MAKNPQWLDRIIGRVRKRANLLAITTDDVPLVLRKMEGLREAVEVVVECFNGVGRINSDSPQGIFVRKSLDDFGKEPG